MTTTMTTTATATAATQSNINGTRPLYAGLSANQIREYQGAVDSATIMERERLDWTVDLEPVKLATTGATIDGQYAIVRQDTREPLYIVGREYQTFQNWEAPRFLDSLLMDGVLKYDTAFAVKGGRQIILSTVFGEAVTLPGGDQLVNRLFWSHYHGGGAINCTPTAYRPWCDNMTAMILAKGRAAGSLFTVRHSGNIDRKLERARDYLLKLTDQFSQHVEQAKRLASAKYTPEQARAYVETLYPTPAESASKRSHTAHEHQLAQLRAAFRSPANTADGVRGTWWALANMVSEAVDHGQPLRQSRDERARRENRFIATTTGAGATLKAKALETALAMMAA